MKFGIRVVTILLLVSSQNVVFAQSACETKAYNATVGLAYKGGHGFQGASGTIYKKEKQTDGTWELTIFTDHHVFEAICPGGLRVGSGCKAYIYFKPIGAKCRATVLTKTVTLIADDNDELHDLSVVKIEGVSNQDVGDADSCIETLGVTQTSPVLKPTLRVGYVGGSKTVSRGTFSGYADSGPFWANRPEYRDDEACDQFSPFNAVSKMPIGPGDCGGPVVSEESCELLALSQVGPINGHSLDLPAQLFEALYNGRKLMHCEAAKLIPHEPWHITINR